MKYESPAEIASTVKGNLISMVRAYVHTTGDPLRKRSSERRNVKTSPVRFSVDGKHFETELFKNDDVTIIK